MMILCRGVGGYRSRRKNRSGFGDGTKVNTLYCSIIYKTFTALTPFDGQQEDISPVINLLQKSRRFAFESCLE